MCPKYRHRGYMDSNSREEREPSRAPRPQLTMEEKIQRRSMRKATDRSANEVMRCHACGNNVHSDEPIGSLSTCPKCSAPLHCCRACAHFDSSSRWQCRSDIEKPIQEKAKSNTCANFSPRLVLDFTGRRGSGGGNGKGSKSNDPRSQFEDLFRN